MALQEAVCDSVQVIARSAGSSGVVNSKRGSLMGTLMCTLGRSCFQTVMRASFTRRLHSQRVGASCGSGRFTHRATKVPNAPGWGIVCPSSWPIQALGRSAEITTMPWC